jgi:hypothetical protein
MRLSDTWLFASNKVVRVKNVHAGQGSCLCLSALTCPVQVCMVYVGKSNEMPIRRFYFAWDESMTTFYN